ncbi:MAG: HlyD family secretion protein [Planctomycetota bacterium]|jgi:HlyD family secretion protein
MKRAIKIAVVLVVIGGLVALIAYSKMAGSVPKVSTEVAARGPVEESVDETAEALLDRTRILCTGSGGILLPVTLEAGSVVAEGQILARIDPADIRARKDAAKAQVESFQAQAKSAEAQKPKPAAFEGAKLAVEGARKRLSMAGKGAAALEEQKRFTELTLARTEALLAEGFAQEARLDELKASVKTLAQQVASAKEAVSAGETEVRAAEAAEKLLKQAGNDPEFLKEAYLAQARASEATLRSLEIEEKRLDVKAPFRGVILERHTRGGQLVAAGTPVFLIGDPSSLEVEVEVLSDDVPLVAKGFDAVLYGGALGEREVRGKVRKIYPKAFSKISSLGIEQKRVKVRIEAPPGTGLKHGYRVEVRIITDSRPDTVRVPAGAVVRKEGKDHVFVFAEGGAEERGRRQG